MKILVIGGTNFIGPHVVRRLASMGHEVSVFHRGHTQAELPQGVNQILGDRARLTDFRPQFEQVAPDVVLDMILLNEQHAQTTMDTFRGIVERVVAVSSMDVYRAYGIIRGLESGFEPVPLTEDSALRSSLYPFQDSPEIKPVADYEKILVEQVVMGDPVLPGTIVRLPMVYGSKDYQHRLKPYLQRMDEGRPIIILEESVANWRGSYGYVENVAVAIALAVTSEQAKNRVYHVADSDIFTEAERISRIGQIAGWQGKVVSMPRSNMPLEWHLGYNTSQHWFIDSSRIREELGYSEVISLDEALRRTVEWERKQPLLENSQTAPYLLGYAVEDEVMTKLDPIKKLTKREYFAALAFQSLIKNSAWIELAHRSRRSHLRRNVEFSQRSEDRGIITDKTLKIAEENNQKIADICVKYADALLARLEGE